MNLEICGIMSTILDIMSYIRFQGGSYGL